jgi:hypothetical protein
MSVSTSSPSSKPVQLEETPIPLTNAAVVRPVSKISRSDSLTVSLVKLVSEVKTLRRIDCIWVQPNVDTVRHDRESRSLVIFPASARFASRSLT